MWKDAVVSPDISIKETLKVINEHACRAAFIVDYRNKLLGIVTDGDVRRALLSEIPLENEVIQIANTSPIVCQEKDAVPENIEKILNNNRFLHVPIVDEENHLINVLTYDNLKHRIKRENPVFIMAGGFGTRLRPLTDNCPKPMLRIGGIPILEHILNQFIENGFYRFFFSTHYLAQQVKEYFKDGSKWNVSIEYIYEETPLGTGGALGLLSEEKIDKPMIVINGDVMTKIDFGKLIEFHEKRQSIATICVREYTHNVPFGVIDIEECYVMGMTEKPTHRSFINAGIYVLDSAIVKEVVFGEKIDLPTILQNYMDKEEQVSSFPIHEYWLDVGRIEDFEQAERDVKAGIF